MPVAVIRKIDHIIVRSGDLHPLLDALTGPLGLAPAWPLCSMPSFTSGVVVVGNTYVEVVALFDHTPPGTRLCRSGL